MSSLYAQYLKEQTNDKIIEIPEGFATYRYLNENQVYIIDIFVKPEFRDQGTGKLLASRVCAEAKDLGIKQLVGTVNLSAKNSTENLKKYLAYGMVLDSCSNNAIVLTKDIF